MHSPHAHLASGISGRGRAGHSDPLRFHCRGLEAQLEANPTDRHRFVGARAGFSRRTRWRAGRPGRVDRRLGAPLPNLRFDTGQQRRRLKEAGTLSPCLRPVEGARPAAVGDDALMPHGDHRPGNDIGPVAAGANEGQRAGWTLLHRRELPEIRLKAEAYTKYGWGRKGDIWPRQITRSRCRGSRCPRGRTGCEGVRNPITAGKRTPRV